MDEQEKDMRISKEEVKRRTRVCFFLTILFGTISSSLINFGFEGFAIIAFIIGFIITFLLSLINFPLLQLCIEWSYKKYQKYSHIYIGLGIMTGLLCIIPILIYAFFAQQINEYQLFIPYCFTAIISVVGYNYYSDKKGMNKKDLNYDVLDEIDFD